MTKGPSLHLSWRELACKDGTAYPEEWKISRAIVLSDIFEEIRWDAGNKPIKVNSAYRTPNHNRKIGGAQKSQHMQGRALDLEPPKGMKIIEFYKIIRKLARAIPSIKGLGRYRTFVHFDIRPTKRLIAWSGKGVKDSLT